jgi:hypothetical protein
MDWSQLQKIETPLDIEKEAKRASAIAYLKDTDWYIIRKIETGKEIPEEVSEKRNSCRNDISTTSAIG